MQATNIPNALKFDSEHKPWSQGLIRAFSSSNSHLSTLPSPIYFIKSILRNTYIEQTRGLTLNSVLKLVYQFFHRNTGKNGKKLLSWPLCLTLEALKREGNMDLSDLKIQ